MCKFSPLNHTVLIWFDILNMFLKKYWIQNVLNNINNSNIIMKCVKNIK